MWIARDKDNELRIFENKPTKGAEYWLSSWANNVYGTLPDEYFPEVKWEDDEPTKVKLVIDK